MRAEYKTFSRAVIYEVRSPQIFSLWVVHFKDNDATTYRVKEYFGF